MLVLPLLLVSEYVSTSQAADATHDLENAYRAYIKAAMAKDWDKIMSLSSTDMRKRMEAMPKEQRGMVLDGMREVIAKEVNSKVDSGQVNGDKGTLKLHVPQEKGSMTGTVSMRKEGGRWRIHSAAWEQKN